MGFTQGVPSVADVILGQIGLSTRAALDIGSSKSYKIEDGLLVKGCLISLRPRRRGNIQITLNGKDLYDMKFADRNGYVIDDETINDIDTEGMVSVLRERALGASQ